MKKGSGAVAGHRPSMAIDNEIALTVDSKADPIARSERSSGRVEPVEIVLQRLFF